MNEDEALRLECLRLAVASGAGDPLWLADIMLDFVQGHPDHCADPGIPLQSQSA